MWAVHGPNNGDETWVVAPAKAMTVAEEQRTKLVRTRAKAIEWAVMHAGTGQEILVVDLRADRGVTLKVESAT